jgi:carbonic anhydrase
VTEIIVLGHSNCGGVQGCYEMCSGRAPELEDSTSFVGRWMDLLRPGFDRLPAGDEPTRQRALEFEAVMTSLDNLMTFPFVAAAVAAGELGLHGLWHDIAEGGLLEFDPATGKFLPV